MPNKTKMPIMKTKNYTPHLRVQTIALSVILLMVGLVLTRCYYNSEEELYISLTDQCDPTNITYESAVQPILQENCLGCHGSSYNSSGGGVDLRTYSQVVANIDAVLGSIKHSNGFAQMPKNSPKLKDCQITIIESWKNAGFPQN
jgi:hypothetical protein